MTNKQGDQDALNGLVDDCYPDGWPWQFGDWYVSGDGSPRIIWTEAKVDIVGRCGERISLYADTWVEGRLIELIGECFSQLTYSGADLGIWACYFTWPKDVKGKGYSDVQEGPTPVTALVAALRVLKQEEQS